MASRRTYGCQDVCPVEPQRASHGTTVAVALQAWRYGLRGGNGYRYDDAYSFATKYCSWY